MKRITDRTKRWRHYREWTERDSEQESERETVSAMERESIIKKGDQRRVNRTRVPVPTVNLDKYNGCMANIEVWSQLCGLFTSKQLLIL